MFKVPGYTYTLNLKRLKPETSEARFQKAPDVIQDFDARSTLRSYKPGKLTFQLFAILPVIAAEDHAV